MAEIDTALVEGAGAVVAMARNLAPEASGDLRRSIGWTRGVAPRGAMTVSRLARSRLGKQLTLTIFAGNDEAHYARFVEFGTAPHAAGGMFKGAHHPGTPAQPFFYPAWRANRRSIRSLIRAAMKRAAQRAAKG